MITNKLYGVREVVMALAIVGALALAGLSTAFAQTTSPYTPPQGYVQYGMYGNLYSPSTGLYYNPMTGQSSSLVPLGPAERNASGAYILPPGYSQYGTTTSYYNSSTGWYYDPTTGFYSKSAPVNTGVTPAMVSAYYSGIFTPGVPNTGVGGDNAKTTAILVMSALMVLTGMTILGKHAVRE